MFHSRDLRKGELEGPHGDCFHVNDEDGYHEGYTEMMDACPGACDSLFTLTPLTGCLYVDLSTLPGHYRVAGQDMT